MSFSRHLVPIAIVALLAFCIPSESHGNQLLVFTKTEGYRHASIELGVEAIRKLSADLGYTIVHSEDAAIFNDTDLSVFSAVVFLSTTGDVLDAGQQAAMERYIQGGGGYVGIHAAADTEYGWDWYGKLVGGYFASHPAIQQAVIEVVDREHVSTAMLPDPWRRVDEWYNYKQFSDDVSVLLELQEDSYEGGEMGDAHPIAWYHAHDGGRAWYTGLGHTAESFSEPLFLQHLSGGIAYAAGKDR